MDGARKPYYGLQKQVLEARSLFEPRLLLDGWSLVSEDKYCIASLAFSNLEGDRGRIFPTCTHARMTSGRGNPHGKIRLVVSFPDPHVLPPERGSGI